MTTPSTNSDSTKKFETTFGDFLCKQNRFSLEGL
jgi:hypothetical protein